MDEFVCGVNYWPRESGVHMWKEWNPESVDAEFRQMGALSLNACRVFLLWEDFQPGPETMSEEAMGKFDELVQIARRHRIGLIPTFFTGHMSGENWDVPWRRDRDPYSDPGMLRAQVRLVREFARRYRGEDAILFWDLANEPDVFVKPASVDAAWLWTHVLYREIKAHDPVHPVTLGIHAWSLFTPGPFRVRDVAEVCDFLCMHPYPSYTDLCPEPLDSLRSSYFVPFACKLTEGLGRKKVLLEEFGSTTQMASEDVEARFFSAALYSALANEVTGALAWCFGDFKRQDRLPYDSTPYEAGFGITAVDGRVKKKGEVLASFARTVKAARMSELSPAPARAAILIPRRYYDNPDPENGPERNAAVLFASFILAKRAGIDVDFITVDELEGAARGFRAIFVPCATRRGTLNVTDFAALRAFAEAGGTLYCSYDGLAVDGMEDLFGASVTCASTPQGDVWSVGVPGCERTPAGPLPKPTPALLARKHLSLSAYGDSLNSGFIVNQYGRGHSLLVTLPFELYLATTPYAFEQAQHPYHEVYSYVASLAGIRSAHVEPNPAVEVREFASPDRRALVVVNHDPRQQTVRIAIPQAGGRPAWSWRRNAPLPSNDGTLRLTLGPSEGDIVEIP
ncbi:MAG: beta-galactosidase [Bacillota bacterium]|nr:beta-galactosidase [Bacillota bacterium]MDI6637841.1 beta-galactosidase [Bacillota bacterium]MDK2930410.1 beta-galactosidase [Bacillota bacterium]